MFDCCVALEDLNISSFNTKNVTDMSYMFGRNPDSQIVEKIPYEEKAIEEIARMAEGGMRDALSLLEQVLAYNPDELKLEDVEKIFGLTSTVDEVELYSKIHNNEISEVIKELRDMYAKGMDTKRLAVDLLEIAKDALIYSEKANDKLLNKLTPVEAQDILSKVSVNNLLGDAKNLENVITKEKQNQNFLTYLELCLINMASPSNVVNKSIEAKIETKIAKNIDEVKITKEKEDDSTQEETKPINQDMDFLLSILLDANRDIKIADQIIYNKLDLYQYEPEKRKFYQLLIGTEMFACNKDAIIITGNQTQVDNINALNTNKELYGFINKEFGIDKMIYAITDVEKKQLIERYKSQPIENRNKPVYVEKYVLEDIKQNCPEDTLNLLFGDIVKVED